MAASYLLAARVLLHLPCSFSLMGDMDDGSVFAVDSMATVLRASPRILYPVPREWSSGMARESENHEEFPP